MQSVRNLSAKSSSRAASFCITRLVAWSLLLVGSTYLAGCQRAPLANSNIVMIIVDTLRADALGSYGNSPDASPEVDRLAEAGVVFERVVANCSWTRPSIASMLTSLHGRTLGIYDEVGDRLDDRFMLLSELLKSAGYTTLGATANPNINSEFGFSQGFDHYIDSREIFHWMQKAGPTKRAGAPQATEERSLPATELFRSVLEYVESGKPPPFYVQLDLMEVHFPGPPLRPETEAAIAAGGYEPTVRYAAALRQVSRDIGEFVRDLTALPGMDDTLFVIVSDHGEGLDDHRGIPRSAGHGWLLYGSNVWVPMIFYDSKGRLGHRRIAQTVQLLDLAPTILDLVGAEIPAGMEGVPRTGLVLGAVPESDAPTFFVTETEFRKAEKIAVYTDEWKYFENRDNHPGTAPRELQPKDGPELGVRTNRLRDHPGEGAQLAASLERWEDIHPKAAATRPRGGISRHLRNQLRAMGYVESDSD
jgi:arylsulfatase A-like enzyme